ncbi:MAG: hypothetical protein JWN24_3914 [Phycisphaerales bacterium]|nr:hypothetical protein [Phycisphaerales bacterium]
MPAPCSHRPLRAVHVALQLETGGLEKLLVEFARHANRDQFDLSFVSLSTRGDVASEIEALGWPVLALEEPAGLRPGLVLRLAKVFRHLEADIVHAHNTKPMIYSGLAARMAGVRRTVYTRHGQRHQAARRQNVLFRLATRLMDAVVCVSEDSAARSIHEGVQQKRIHTIWNGIDSNRFSYLGPAERGPAVMVGRLSAEKDVDTLLQAVALVMGREPLFRLEIAGAGPCLPALRQKAKELALLGCVDFLGNVDDVPALLKRASLSVLSSVTEGISLTLLEAMSRGLPVVATRVGGNPEIVIDGETGFLVPARDPGLLADAILKVWRDPQMGRKLGLAGHQRVRNYFDVRRMMADYEMLYRSGAFAEPRTTPHGAELVSPSGASRTASLSQC